MASQKLLNEVRGGMHHLHYAISGTGIRVPGLSLLHAALNDLASRVHENAEMFRNAVVTEHEPAKGHFLVEKT